MLLPVGSVMRMGMGGRYLLKKGKGEENRINHTGKA